YPLRKGLGMRTFTSVDSLRDNIVRVLRPMGGAGPYFWVGTHDEGVAVLDLEFRRIRNLSSREPWVWGQVNDILDMESGRAWVATEGGDLIEMVFRGDSLSLGQKIHLEDKKIHRIIRGRSGLIWAATNKGLSPITI